ncbi:DUF4433 domain-containing protein [Vibrio sp. Vb0937]|uniref:DUF4433 domain-containing protein n=1 Tax=unclassified Vibrio TaxID=2614977 RepID=UPI0021D0DB7C|nr:MULTISPECIES: DUF4433 domain-containing protein [unclassified Vibrio]MDW1827805.1 DUF4433 domain-containing protein [Vibrio sp. Vb0937]MDW3189013.1 DUF4433 domain-containing protein [Vibrio sp. Vb0932]
MKNKEEIKKFAQELKIPYLLHFTHISNLESILKWGLESRKKVDEDYENVITNDQGRYDGRADTISLSIAHPNDKMFFKYRESDQDWCVLGLDPSVLWELDCLFCKHNAADGLISHLDDDTLSKVSSFKGMYDEVNWLPSREEQSLLGYDPTDVQAEVLVKKHIPAHKIFGVIVSSRQVKKNIAEFTGDIKVAINEPNKYVYATRTYRRRWQ